VGADRVLFGTDGPFHHPSVEIQKVLTSGLSEQEQENVFYNNAARLMKLP
jgi:predicted TIM-barrel fold metal-dependent hydrolase